jgi:tRNA threonylcarbamoyladenosine biosynthesis protein TsaE
LGEAFGKTLAPGAVASLDGPLGAGKSVFARGVARALGVVGPVRSPTYAIVNEYERADGGRLFHIDAYRLRDGEDFEAAGGGECFDGEAIAVVEWGERIGSALPPWTLKVEVRMLSDGKREFVRSQ